MPSPALSEKMRTGLRGGAIVGLLIGFIHAAFGSASSAGVALSAGILLLLLSEADKFEVLKGFGFEAKMHRLTTTIEEAQKISEHLRTLALSTARNVVALVSNADGYTEMYSRRSAWNMIEGVRDNLVSLEIEQSKIEDVLKPYLQLVEKQLTYSGAHKANVMLNGIQLFYAADPDAVAIAQQARIFPQGWDPEECRRIARAVVALKVRHPNGEHLDPQEFFDIADDLAQWQRNRTLRRPETYFNEG